MTDIIKIIMLFGAEFLAMMVCGNIGGVAGFAMWLMATLLIVAMVIADNYKEKALNPKQREQIKLRFKNWVKEEENK